MYIKYFKIDASPFRNLNLAYKVLYHLYQISSFTVIPVSYTHLDVYKRQVKTLHTNTLTNFFLVSILIWLLVNKFLLLWNACFARATLLLISARHLFPLVTMLPR